MWRRESILWLTFVNWSHMIDIMSSSLFLFNTPIPIFPPLIQLEHYQKLILIYSNYFLFLVDLNKCTCWNCFLFCVIILGGTIYKFVVSSVCISMHLSSSFLLLTQSKLWLKEFQTKIKLFLDWNSLVSISCTEEADSTFLDCLWHT